MKYYLCLKPCIISVCRRVYFYSFCFSKPGIKNNSDYFFLNEQERKIYREAMVKEGYKYEDC